MRDDDKRLAVFFTQSGERLPEAMWIPRHQSTIRAFKPPIVDLRVGSAYSSPPEDISFNWSGITVGQVSFYLESGPAKSWWREVMVTPEFLTDSAVFAEGLVSAALPKDADPHTAKLWCLRVLPSASHVKAPGVKLAHKPWEEGDFIRLWLCGAAVKGFAMRRLSPYDVARFFDVPAHLLTVPELPPWRPER
jgi:hypothetical protein